MSNFRKYVAEFLGTFVLVFFACGTAIVTSANVVATALSFGLVIVAMAYSIGGISGCHINPAVSIAMLFTKKMSVKEFFGYVISQFFGATIGAGVLYLCVKGAGIDMTGDAFVWATNAMVGTGALGIISSILIEVILTFVFVYVIINVVNSKTIGNLGGLVIGLTLTLVHLLGINLTGTSVNPARSFGPALMRLVFGGGSIALEQVWIFIVAPIIGGILAGIIYNALNKPTEIVIEKQ